MGSGSDHGRLARRSSSGDAITRYPDSNLRGLETSHLDFHFGVELYLQRQTVLALHLCLQSSNRRTVQLFATARDGSLQQGRVLLAMHEGGYTSVANINVV